MGQTIESVRAARDGLASELGRSPSLAEIGKRLGITGERVRQVLSAAGDCTRARCEEIKSATMAAREAREAEALALYETGLSQAEVGQRLGLTQQWVSLVLEKYGKASRGTGRAWTFVEHVQLLRRRTDGASLSALAREFGLSSSCVNAHLTRLRQNNAYARAVQRAACAADPDESATSRS